MRYVVMNEAYENKETGRVEPKVVKLKGLSLGDPLPSNHKSYYLPRVRCLDCPGKLYNVGPGQMVTNFELHLKNRQHMSNVLNRIR
jgi:SWI/SNF-related matrix-associated actin-dependent regulator of chromatin subfamily B protein 1